MQSTATILQVEGMTCHGCVRRIDHALRMIDGVMDVDVQLRAGRVRVCHDRRAAPLEVLVAALRESGYSPSVAK